MAPDPRDQHEEENVDDVPAKAEESKAKAEKAKAEEKPKAKPRARKKKEDATPADDDSAAEDKPKPKRKPAAKKKAEPKAEDKADDTPDEPTADEVAEKAKPDEVDKPKRRRRGSAETSAAAGRKPAARRDGDGKVVVRAKARYVRTAPRKARLVVDHIRGKSVDEARAILIHTPRAASRDVLKLLDSAIANAENNHELVADELKIDRVFVDEGPTLKRFRPRALGRATQIRKRTSHMTILLTPKE
jgi:ribosomal protein L22